MELIKTCSKCKTVKDISEFNKDRNCLYGVRSDCRSCRKIDLHDSRQRILINKFDNGDKTISICDCGNYFQKIRKMPSHYGERLRTLKGCRECYSRGSFLSL